jgi:hypothetical protein
MSSEPRAGAAGSRAERPRAARASGARARRVLLVAAVAGLVVAGCHRRSAEGTDGRAAPSAVAAAPLEPTSLTEVGAAIAAVDLRVEARRGVAVATDALLVRHRAVLEGHFKGPAPHPLAFQVVAAGAGRAAVLLQATQGEANPLIWLVDASGEILWTKDHPTGGVNPGVSQPSLAAGPDGHVCLAWCNGSTDSIALRRWAEDGGAFADYDVLHADVCDALSVLYWPHHGWLIGIAHPAGATLQRMGENGGRAWGDDGLRLPWAWRVAAPISLALDTENSVLLFRLGQSGGPGSAEYVFASRWSPDGRPKWPGPLSVKRLIGSVSDPSVRLVLEPAPDGAIRATLPAAAVGGPGGLAAAVVEVASDGTVTRR